MCPVAAGQLTSSLVVLRGSHEPAREDKQASCRVTFGQTIFVVQSYMKAPQGNSKKSFLCLYGILFFLSKIADKQTFSPQ